MLNKIDKKLKKENRKVLKITHNVNAIKCNFFSYKS